MLTMNVLLKISSVVVVALVVGATLWPSNAASGTWYVSVDGMGDAPTIQAAIDSAAIGDSIVVGPGTYELGGGIIMKNKGLALVSEMGPGQTILVPRPGSQPLTAIVCASLTRTTWVEGFWFRDFVYGTQVDVGTLLITDCYKVYVRNNVFTGCAPSAIQVPTNGGVGIENNMFTGNVLAIDGYPDGVIRYNIVWDDVALPGNIAINFCNDFLDLNQIPIHSRTSNFQLDPKFCDEAGLELSLQTSSPCIPENSPLSSCTVVLGAFPVGCTVPTERQTWGNIKSRYVE